MSSVARRPYVAILCMALGCWALLIGAAGAGWAAITAGSGVAIAAEIRRPSPVAAECAGEAHRSELRIAALRD